MSYGLQLFFQVRKQYWPNVGCIAISGYINIGCIRILTKYHPNKVEGYISNIALISPLNFSSFRCQLRLANISAKVAFYCKDNIDIILFVLAISGSINIDCIRSLMKYRPIMIQGYIFQYCTDITTEYVVILLPIFLQ